MNAKKILAVLSFLLIAIFLMACNQESQVITPDDSSVQKLYEISQDEIDGLIYMRLSEKLARDVYTTLGDEWGYIAFLNIKLSEQNHMDAVKRMLDKYLITDPIVSDVVGEFPDQDFQDLYDAYVTQGEISLEEALLAGVNIEEENIAYLTAQLLVVTNPDVIRLYNNLKAGSVKHLAAFINCISELP